MSDTTFNHPTLKHPGMLLLRKNVRAEALRELIFAVSVSALCAAVVFYLMILFWSDVLIAIIIATTLTVLLLAVAFWIDKSWQEYQSAEADFLELVYQRPESIVWVYGETRCQMPFGIELFKHGWLHFNLKDGTTRSVRIPFQRLTMVSKFLNRLLPNCLFGFTEERALLFQVDPEALRDSL